MALNTLEEDLTPEQKELAARAREEEFLRKAAATPVLGYGNETDEQEEAAAKAQDVTVDALRGQRLEQRFADVFGRPLLHKGLKPFEVGEASIPPSLTRPVSMSPQQVRARSRSGLGLEVPQERLREPVDMPETVPSLTMPSGVPAKTSDFAALQKTLSPGTLTSPPAGVPVVQAPPPTTPDVPTAPVAKMADSRPQTSVAPPPPPPSAPEAGAAGDDVLGRLGFGQALVRALEGSGSIIAGRDLRSGTAETLGERMKQIEALRAKREEQGLEQARERSTWGASNRGQLNSMLAQFKDNPTVKAALEALEPSLETTKPSDFQRAVGASIMTPPKVKSVEAATASKEAGTQEKRELTPGKKRKLQTAADLDVARAAQGWARTNAAAKQAAAKLTEGKPDTFRKEVNEKAQTLGTAVAKEYGEIAAALKEADRSLVAVRGAAPDLFAKVAQSTSLDGLNTEAERALFRSIGELRRSAQKAQSGLAVTEPERREFLATFGQNWAQDPRTLLEAVDWMRRKTRDKLNTTFATYRAQGDVGNTAIQAYEQAEGVTPNAEYLKSFSERAPKTPPAASTGGTVKVRHKATGKTATVDRAKADEMLKRPDFEEVK